jgi:hypothetical protein
MSSFMPANQLTWQRREQRIGGLLRIRSWTGRDVLPHDEGVSQRGSTSRNDLHTAGSASSVGSAGVITRSTAPSGRSAVTSPVR